MGFGGYGGFGLVVVLFPCFERKMGELEDLEEVYMPEVEEADSHWRKNQSFY